MLRVNKRGQEGVSTTSIIAMVIGVLVLVVVGYFVWKAGSQTQDIAKLLPDQFQKAILYCENSPFKNNLGQYCSDYKEFTLSNQVHYYNCYELGNMAPSKPEWATNENLNCADGAAREVAQCYLLQQSGKTSSATFVGDTECSKAIEYCKNKDAYPATKCILASDASKCSGESYPSFNDCDSSIGF